MRQIEYAEAKRLVEAEHYTRKMPSVPQYIIGDGHPVYALAVFGQPASPRVKESPFGKENAKLVMELQRLVMKRPHERNALSAFLSKAIKMLPQPMIIVSYADTDQGHTGAIYKATNWMYCGCSRPRRDRDPGDGKHSRHVTRDMPFKARSSKHRFLFLHGDRRFKKRIMKDLRWNVEARN